MHRPPLQWSLTGLLILVAGVALNVWLFRFGTLLGLLGLSVTKHLVIAWLCQVVGVDRRDREARRGASNPAGPATTGPLGPPRSASRAIGRGCEGRARPASGRDSGVGADRPPR